jgi:hypothetical protein
MASPARINARKPWTSEELDLLRRLAQAGVPTGHIAERFGRSMSSVSKQAEKLGISVSERSTTRSLNRRCEVNSPEGEPPTS